MQFNPNDFSVENYQKAVGKEFNGEKVENFLGRATRGYLPENYFKPLPLGSSVDKYLGDIPCKEFYRHGLLYYKKGYEFLLNPGGWKVLKIDISLPKAILFAVDKHLFIERHYSEGRVFGSYGENDSFFKPGNHFKDLSKLSKRDFENAKFEEVIGLFIDKESDEHSLYHTYSGGITLEKITEKTSRGIRRELEKLLAKGMYELNEKGIFYSECVPTNFKYNGDKIICNPHNCMDVGKCESDVSDISVILYTHDWIRKQSFIKEYLGRDYYETEKRKGLIRNLKREMQFLEEGETSQIAPLWRKRRKVKIQPHF